jgi:hypothetical protein
MRELGAHGSIGFALRRNDLVATELIGSVAQALVLPRLRDPFTRL